MPASASGLTTLELIGSPEAGPEIAEIVGIGAIDDRVEAKLGGLCLHLAVELGLAEEAALMGVVGVARIGQLHGFDHDVGCAELRRNRFRLGDLLFGVAGR